MDSLTSILRYTVVREIELWENTYSWSSNRMYTYSCSSTVCIGDVFDLLELSWGRSIRQEIQECNVKLCFLLSGNSVYQLSILCVRFLILFYMELCYGLLCYLGYVFSRFDYDFLLLVSYRWFHFIRFHGISILLCLVLTEILLWPSLLLSDSY